MIVGVLLAAGAGSRFGGEKLLAPVPGGAVASLAARALLPAVDRGVAVVRTGDAALARLLEADGLAVLPFDRAERGMGASLAFGVASEPDADGWIVALADMPFVRPETVKALARELRAGASIVVPVSNGRRGHPVGFSRELLRELVRLDGDEGGRSILRRHATQIVYLQCNDEGVTRDVDRPEDLSQS